MLQILKNSESKLKASTSRNEHLQHLWLFFVWCSSRCRDLLPADASRSHAEREREIEIESDQKWSGGPSAFGSFVTPKPGRKKEKKESVCVCLCVCVKTVTCYFA